MRSLHVVAVLLVASPMALGFACSSADANKPAATASGGSSAGDAGAGGAAGTGAGGTGAETQGGMDSSGGNGAGPGPGPTGAGAGPSLCKTSGDGAIFGFTHPDCAPCATMWCAQEYNDAYGPMWSTGDLSSGGACQAYESCASGKCKCAPACVMKTCTTALSMQCQVARGKVDTCMSMSCYLPCGLPATSDAGPN